jgi:hypothetical protein
MKADELINKSYTLFDEKIPDHIHQLLKDNLKFNIQIFTNSEYDHDTDDENYDSDRSSVADDYIKNEYLIISYIWGNEKVELSRIKRSGYDYYGVYREECEYHIPSNNDEMDWFKDPFEHIKSWNDIQKLNPPTIPCALIVLLSADWDNLAEIAYAP